jgi:histidinol phosphatase-like PHP family hydrolase
VEIAGLLLDMATVQATRQKGFGYKRAAYAVFALDHQIERDVMAGTLRDIHGIGPAVERIVREYVETGRSTAIDAAIEAATPAARQNVLNRRMLRSNFLSWAGVLDALAADLPGAVSPADYRGDFQMHTTWSDGAVDIETMAQAGAARGWTRICVTDHSYGLPIARGMSMEHVRRQHREIEELNETLAGRFRVLKGVEANITADGEVDMAPDELATFELVVASPHSVLRKTYDQTRRMLGAVRTRGVHVLGHPRGRLFNSRPGVMADWDRVFAAAARRGVAIELDGTWDRQDIDYELARRALDAGCVFAVDSDAHSIRELEFVDYGLARAWRASRQIA